MTRSYPPSGRRGHFARESATRRIIALLRDAGEQPAGAGSAVAQHPLRARDRVVEKARVLLAGASRS